MASKGALAMLDDDSVLERISSGEIMRSIASELGVRKQSLRERLMKHPKYSEAIQDQAESIVEAATEECMNCEPDMPVIARARLRLEAAHKWAAARDPARWAANKPSPGGSGVTIVVIDRGQTGVIEGQVVAETPMLQRDKAITGQTE